MLVLHRSPNQQLAQIIRIITAHSLLSHDSLIAHQRTYFMTPTAFLPINSGQLTRVTRVPSGRGWCRNTDGYVVANLDNRLVLLSRFLLNAPPTATVIHLN